MLSLIKKYFKSSKPLNIRGVERGNQFETDVATKPTSQSIELRPDDAEQLPLPVFKYYPDPVGNKSIVKKLAICPCCEKARNYMYAGNVYCVEDIEEVCPWCIADGTAAKKWDAGFIDMAYSDNVDPKIVDEINTRTPGFETWQGSKWLFSDTDAMIFIGEVDGGSLVKGQNVSKIQAVLNAINEYDWGWDADDLSKHIKGSNMSIYLFEDRDTGEHRAYFDLS